LPTAPPYTVYVGNLTFETEESELLGFFGDLKPTTARLVKVEGKSKGFGYVEFGDVEKLKQALDLSGSQLGGRTVRISVAEAREYRLPRVGTIVR
jgi:translation initiation factor 4B